MTSVILTHAFSYSGTKGATLLCTIHYASAGFGIPPIDVCKADDFLRCPAEIHGTRRVVYQLDHLLENVILYSVKIKIRI